MTIFKKAKVIIWWSEEDQCYRADIQSEKTGILKTHGDSMEEALREAKTIFKFDLEGQFVKKGRKWCPGCGYSFKGYQCPRCGGE